MTSIHSKNKFNSHVTLKKNISREKQFGSFNFYCHSQINFNLLFQNYALTDDLQTKMSYLLVSHELFIELPTLFKGIDRKTVAIKAKNRRLDTGTERGHSSPSKRTLFHANPNHILHARLYRYQKQIKNFFIAEIIFNLLLLWEDRRTNAFTKASFNRKLNEVSKWFL